MPNHTRQIHNAHTQNRSQLLYPISRPEGMTYQEAIEEALQDLQLSLPLGDISRGLSPHTPANAPADTFGNASDKGGDNDSV